MSVADFMFTPAVQRVIGATLLAPHKSFTLRELLRLADSGRGSAQKQIDRLVQFGVLVEDERRGKQRCIRANTEFVLYPELLAIARKSFAVREPLRESLKPFADQISKAFVFGSVAKGSDTTQSDVDLIVVGTPSLLELSEAMHQTEATLGRPINFSLYSENEWKELIESDPVISQIAQGPSIKIL